MQGRGAGPCDGSMVRSTGKGGGGARAVPGKGASDCYPSDVGVRSGEEARQGEHGRRSQSAARGSQGVV